MATPATFTVKIEANPELVSELKSIVEGNPEVMKLDYAGPSNQPSHLRLGLAEVATIIAIVKGAGELAKFAHAIYKYLSEKKTQRITIQSPLKAIQILSSDAVSEERVTELINSSLRL